MHINDSVQSAQVASLLEDLRISASMTIMKIYLHRIADDYLKGAIRYVNLTENERDEIEFTKETRDRFWGNL